MPRNELLCLTIPRKDLQLDLSESPVEVATLYLHES